MDQYKKVLISFRNKQALKSLLENTLYLITILLLSFLVFSFFTYHLTTSFEFYDALRSWSVIAKFFAGIVIALFIIRFLFTIPSIKKIAHIVSEHDPKQNEIILSAYEFEKSSNLSFYSKEILEKAMSDANKRASELKFSKIFPAATIKKSFHYISFAFIACILVLLINPVLLTTSVKMILHPAGFAPHYDSFIEVSPGNTKILKGSNLPIRIGNYYPELSYNIHIEQQKRRKTVNLTSSTYTFYNVTDSLHYVLSNEYAHTDTFTVQVLEKPLIKDLQISYFYPQYTQLKNRTENDISGKILAIRGAKITEVLIVNNELTEYRIVFSDGTTKELERIGKFTFRTQFLIEKSGSYHFYLKDILGNTNNIVERTIFAEEDLPPKIQIMLPARDKILAQNMQEQIDFTTYDDFGVQKIEILYKKNDGEYLSKTVFDTTGITTLAASYNFDVSDQNLLPGDVIFYYLKVSDNCTIPEAHTSNSKIYLLKFPSIEELYEEIQKQQTGNMDEMRESLEESRKNKEKFDELRRKYLKNEEMDWQQKEDLKEVLKKQKELAKKAEETAKEYEKFVDELEKNKAVAQETLEKLRQIHELMNEISSPELEEAMKELQKQMENISPEQMKNALNNFQFSQEEFNKKLQQTLDLLKSIQLEQKLQKALQQAEELEKLQNQLNEQTSERIEKNQQLNDLGQSQSDIKEKYESLKKDLAELAKELAENKEKNAANELEKGLQQATQSKLGETMQAAAQQLNLDDKQVKKKQPEILVGLSELRNSIYMAQMKMQASLMTEFQKLLKKTLNEMLFLKTRAFP